jgi:hypothetical protein
MPASLTPWTSTSRLNGPQLAGWVTTVAAGGPPSVWLTLRWTKPSTSASSRSTDTGVPPSSSGVGSPTRRLNSRARRSGLDVARRSAGSPTRNVPSSVSTTTVGIDVIRYPRVTTSARPPRAMAAAVYVVPRSIPRQ